MDWTKFNKIIKNSNNIILFAGYKLMDYTLEIY